MSNIEVQFSLDRNKKEEKIKIDKKTYERFSLFFVIMIVLFGIFKVTQSYVVKVVLKDTLVSYEAISEMIATYVLISGVATIIISWLIGKLVKVKHLSPVSMFGFYVFFSLIAASVCLVKGTIYFFVTLEIVRRVFERSLYQPADQMTISSFIGAYRHRFKSIQNFFYYTLIPVPFAILFSIPAVQSSPYQKQGILILIISSLILLLAALIFFKKKYRDLLYSFIKSGHKTAATMAIQALSFLKPRRYEDFLINLLKMSPKKILRKNIILSLGYSPEQATVDIITKEFDSQREEIQLAVLDALFVSRDYRAIQFMIDVVKVEEKPKSLRVRINATKMVAAIYGKKAIPFLLNGLRDTDSRVVANTLETLSIYQDKKLIQYFVDFKENSVPRVKANALLGLSYFSKTRKFYREEITKMLQGGNLNMKASALYVVGVKKDSFFRDYMFDIFVSPERDNILIKRNLAWALLRIDSKEAYELFDEMLTSKGEEAGIMHHFSQMEKEMRFDIVKYIASKHYSDPEKIMNIHNHFDKTKFDFSEEQIYFELIVRKRKQKGKIKDNRL